MSISPRKSLIGRNSLLSNQDFQGKSISSGIDLRQKISAFKANSDSRKPSFFETNQNTQNNLSPSKAEEAKNLLAMKENLSQNEMYDRENWRDYGNINNSESLGIELMEKIIQNGSDILYDKYLKAKQCKHVFNSVMYLSELSWQQERLIHDLDFDLNKQKPYFNYPFQDYIIKYTDTIEEDQEPEMPARENRRNFNVEVEKKQMITQEDSIDQARNQIIDQLMNQSIQKNERRQKRQKKSRVSGLDLNLQTLHKESRGSSPQTQSLFQSIKDVESINMEEEIDRDAMIIEQYNQAVFQEHNVQFVQLHEQYDIDRVEEQLRLLKQRELELQQSKAEFEALRLIEQKEQQLRLKNINKGGENNERRLIAYDYNGQVFPMNQIKSEKYPNSTIVLQHTVTRAETTQIDYNVSLKAAQKAHKRKLKQSQNQNEIDDTSSIDKQSNHSGKDIIRKRQTTINSVQAVKKNSINLGNTPVNSLGNAKKDLYPFGKKDGFSSHRETVFQQNQEVFEIFKANKGVTFIEGGRIKKGPKFNTVANSVDLSLMVDKDYGKKINLTKNDYNSLIGNLTNMSLGEDATVGNISRASSQHSFHSQSILKKNADKIDIRLPLHLLNQAQSVATPQSISYPNKHDISNTKTPILQHQVIKSQSQNIFSDNSQILNNYLDNNNNSGNIPITPNQHNSSSINLTNNNNLNNSSLMKKKNFFSSQKKLQPIDTSKISVSSMEILQTLALDDHDYVMKLLNQNQIDQKRSQFSSNIASDRGGGEQQKENQKQGKKKYTMTDQSQSGEQEMESGQSMNNVTLNRSNQNNSALLNASLHNMSTISHSSKKGNHSYIQGIIPITMPTDEYNRIIITGGMDWGNPLPDSVRRNIDNNSATAKVDDQFKQKHTLGYHGKFPRDRLMKKTLQEMSYSHLSPPEIGKTMGYGAGKGFHPDQLINVKQFIQEQQQHPSQQNNSQLNHSSLNNNNNNNNSNNNMLNQ